MVKKKYHTISNAYEAWWFLYEHPKLTLPERNEVTPKEAKELEARGFWITRDTGGKCYRMYRHLHRHAIQEGLDIFYTKTSTPGGHGRVQDDRSKNKYVECWLEFGPMYYGYGYSGTTTPMAEWDNETHRLHSHAIDLDTGGQTFDEALINLAKLVLKNKRYGDYKSNGIDERSTGKCGKPVCADCKDIGRTVKRLGLEKK